FEVTVAEGATVERDLVLEDSGRLIGSVVDQAGRAAPGFRILATSSGDSGESPMSDAAGAFAFEALRPGDYNVVAYRDFSGREPRVKATVRAGETATVQLTVEAQSGTITGTV